MLIARSRNAVPPRWVRRRQVHERRRQVSWLFLWRDKVGAAYAWPAGRTREEVRVDPGRFVLSPDAPWPGAIAMDDGTPRQRLGRTTSHLAATRWVCTAALRNPACVARSYWSCGQWHAFGIPTNPTAQWPLGCIGWAAADSMEAIAKKIA